MHVIMPYEQNAGQIHNVNMVNESLEHVAELKYWGTT
jgi:hypothetical protein